MYQTVSKRGILLLVATIGFGLFAGPVMAREAPDTRTDLSTPQSRGDSSYQPLKDPFATHAKNEVSLPDPIEPWNRLMFQFNDISYEFAMEPTARFYHDYVGNSIRHGVRNVFWNLDEPRNAVNGLLQGRPSDVVASLGRFAINSTIGIGGIYDPASNHIPRKERQLDQTFASWGIPPGMYIVWPFYGSSSLRGTVGEIGDGFLYPPYYLEGEDADWGRVGLYGFREVNKMSFQLGRYEEFKNMAVDPYIGLKNAYEQQLEDQLRALKKRK